VVAILGVFRGYRSGFENDELISSLRRLREKESGKGEDSARAEETDFANILRDIQNLVDQKKRKEALMALVAARLRLNDLKASARLRDRLEMEFVRLRAEIDAL